MGWLLARDARDNSTGGGAGHGPAGGSFSPRARCAKLHFMTSAPRHSRLPIPASITPMPAFFTLVSLEQVDMILSIVLTLAAIAVVGALALALWRELANDTVVIAPIAVPRDLAERGLRAAGRGGAAARRVPGAARGVRNLLPAAHGAARGRRARRPASGWAH